MDAPRARLPLLLHAGAAGLFVAASAVAVLRSYLPLTGDQWRIYADYLRLPFPSNILQIQNGHRPIVPSAAYLADLHWLGAENHLSSILGVLCALAVVALLAVESGRERQVDPEVRAAAAGLAGVLVFWFASLRVLGHGNGSLHFYPVVLFYLLAVGALLGRGLAGERRVSAGGLALAVLACTLATFTYSFGAVTWPALIVLALVLGLPWRVPLVLTGGLATCLALSFTVLPGSEDTRPRTYADPLEWWVHASVWLGSPLRTAALGFRPVGTQGVATLVCGVAGGLVLLAVGLWALSAWSRRGRLSRLEAVALALAVLGVGCAFLVVLGRAKYFRNLPEQRFDWRYQPWALLAWLGGGIGLVLAAGRRRGWRRYAVAAALWGLLLALLPLHLSYHGIFTAHRRGIEEAQLALAVGVWDEAKIRGSLWPNRSMIERVDAHLATTGDAMYSWPAVRALGAPPVGPPADPARLAGEVTEVRPVGEGEWSGLLVRGWAWDRESGEPPRHVVVVGPQGTVVGAAIFTRRQPARARAVGAEATQFLGFHGYVAGYDRRPGYTLLAKLADGTLAPLGALEPPAGPAPGPAAGAAAGAPAGPAAGSEIPLEIPPGNHPS